jgi:UDP-glucuronate decarboxylase
MSEADGRLVPALIDAALEGKPFPIHGTGKQTRSMTYVDDAVSLLRILMDSKTAGCAPVNVGNDEEWSVEDVARTLATVAGIEYAAVQLPGREQDPQRRKPDLTRAKTFGWSPTTPLKDGLRATYRWFREARLVYA